MYEVQNLKSDESSQQRVTHEVAEIIRQIRAEKAEGITHKPDNGQFNNSNFGMGM